MKKFITSIILCFACASQSIAQEKLYLKTQREPIDCQITEINTAEVKYKPSDAEQLTIGVSINDVDKIVFKSGRVQYFRDPLKDFNFYKGQKKWNLKFGLLSPASGFTDFVLEKSVKPGRSVEYQLNVIGLGKNVNITSQLYGTNQELMFDQMGASVGIGLKVLRMPDFQTTNRRLQHILQGGYLKPAVQLGYYQRNFVYYDPNTFLLTTRKQGVVNTMISMTIGQQWILDNTFSIDIYGLIGIGFDNFRRQQFNLAQEVNPSDPSSYLDQMPYRNFGYTRFGRGDAGVALGGGLRLGYLFNTKKKKDSAGMDRMRERLKQ